MTAEQVFKPETKGRRWHIEPCPKTSGYAMSSHDLKGIVATVSDRK